MGWDLACFKEEAFQGMSVPCVETQPFAQRKTASKRSLTPLLAAGVVEQRLHWGRCIFEKRLKQTRVAIQILQDLSVSQLATF